MEDLQPQVDGGRFPVKRVWGEQVHVEAAVFADGHDRLECRLVHQPPGAARWIDVPMEPRGNDRWAASFVAGGPDGPRCGRHRFRVLGWIHPMATVVDGIRRKRAAGVEVTSDLLVAAQLLDEGAARSRGPLAAALSEAAEAIRRGDGLAAEGGVSGGGDTPVDDDHEEAHGTDDTDEAEELVRLHARTLPRPAATTSATLEVDVERERAAHGAWYELFPRSWSPEPGRHGTLDDVADHVGYVSDLGFDVLYLPPIHPIGKVKRKGPDNAVRAAPHDPGSPWAIGSAEGGHTAVAPELGGIDAFRRLRSATTAAGLELALDLAFQCAPDHPWVTEHPEWFGHRPDGTIQYAENPPKRYEDIYPFDFDSISWRELWQALADVVRFWIDEGVQIFRVDNPHTKPFAFWEWLIGEVRSEHPEVVFLSEAFSRPRIMHRLAKLGFSQSYTYFTWRVAAWELREYFAELSTPPGVEYLRPNAWPNTPDILAYHLQRAPRAAFAARFVLAATLSPNYGIYGPAFELGENEPLRPDTEEYRSAEKYEVRAWDLDDPASLAPLIARVNAIRHQQPALAQLRTLRFHGIDNENLLCFTKSAPDAATVLVIVNLDPTWVQAGWTDLDLEGLGLESDGSFTLHDLLSDHRFRWDGPRNFVQLDPAETPAHIMVVQPGDGLDGSTP